MDEQRINEIVNAISGLKASEWARIKQHVDMGFSSAAAKAQLDDSELLKTNLRAEFNLRRFGEKLD